MSGTHPCLCLSSPAKKKKASASLDTASDPSPEPALEHAVRVVRLVNVVDEAQLGRDGEEECVMALGRQAATHVSVDKLLAIDIELLAVRI